MHILLCTAESRLSLCQLIDRRVEACHALVRSPRPPLDSDLRAVGTGRHKGAWGTPPPLLVAICKIFCLKCPSKGQLISKFGVIVSAKKPTNFLLGISLLIDYVKYLAPNEWNKVHLFFDPTTF